MTLMEFSGLNRLLGLRDGYFMTKRGCVRQLDSVIVQNCHLYATV